MIITKTQNRILYKTIELSNNGQAIVSWYAVARALDMQPDIVIKAMKVLVAEGLLEYVYQSGTTIPAGVILTSYSQNLREYKLAKFKNILLNSFAIPVGVSVATTLITLWLKGLL